MGIIYVNSDKISLDNPNNYIYNLNRYLEGIPTAGLESGDFLHPYFSPVRMRDFLLTLVKTH